MVWYESLFDERYLAFYEELFDTSVADRDAAFIETVLALEPGQRLLELGCGFGRHAVAFARDGLTVTGVELSGSMLGIARKLAEEASVEVRWEQRDIRSLDRLGPFDACTCLYTVLGYFGDEENEAVLRSVHDALSPHGTVLFDLTNPLPLIARWPSESWKEISTGVRRESSRYDALTARVSTDRVLYRHDGGKLQLPRSEVRLYAPHEVRAMLTRSGFEIEQVFGGLRGEPFDGQKSLRQVWVARRGSAQPG